MSGIYFHIPFCQKKCAYCDFYSTSNVGNIEKLIDSEVKELCLRYDYLIDKQINTIYFGGGTPSLLSSFQISKLLNEVKRLFIVAPDAEITLEANPEDLSDSYILDLVDCGINRLSIGFQSFDDDVLRFFGRRHNNKNLKHIVEFAQLSGFDNISVDLIFGYPGFDASIYINSLKSAIALDIQHISAYSLTYAEGTLLYKKLKNNQLTLLDETSSVDLFYKTIDTLKAGGFEQYEISNYAKAGFKSRHNSAYWEGVHYLGIGPSAHSYNGLSRQWNVSNSSLYCSAIEERKSFYNIEILTIKDRYNEYIITRLRTIKGISQLYFDTFFGEPYKSYFYKELNKLLYQNLVLIKEGYITLTRKGLIISDFIIETLYYA